VWCVDVEKYVENDKWKFDIYRLRYRYDDYNDEKKYFLFY